jgi:hypothetical protein
MTFKFFDRQDLSNPLNGTAMRNDTELIESIDWLNGRAPFVAGLQAENGCYLQVGLGGEMGFAQYSDGQGSSWVALERDAPARNALPDEEYEECLEFLIGDTLSPIPRRFGLGPERVRQVAVEFRHTCERSPAVLWEQN